MKCSSLNTCNGESQKEERLKKGNWGGAILATQSGNFKVFACEMLVFRGNFTKITHELNHISEPIWRSYVVCWWFSWVLLIGIIHYRLGDRPWLGTCRGFCAIDSLIMCWIIWCNVLLFSWITRVNLSTSWASWWASHNHKGSPVHRSPSPTFSSRDFHFLCCCVKCMSSKVKSIY